MNLNTNINNINNINMSEEIVTIPFPRQCGETTTFCFKMAHTGEKILLEIPVDISITNFIEHVKYEAYFVFNINRNQRIEIVECGQGNQEIRDEDAPAIHRDFNTTIRRKYNGDYTNKAFYIRLL
jgi:hypothetical protein